MSSIIRISAGLALLALILTAPASEAIGPKDLKKKAEKAAKQEAEKVVGKTEAAEAPAEAAGESGEAGVAGSGDQGTVASVSTKYDFVPGKKVLLMDDFTRDELGEFPSRWKALNGNFDIAEFKGERWLRMNATDGLVSIKGGAPPEKWTLEFDFYQEEITGPVFTVGGLYPNSDSFLWYSTIGGSGTTVTFNGPDGVYSTAELAGGLHGRHHVSVMAAGTSIKIYVDRERLVNIPEMEMKDQTVGSIGLRLWRYGPDPMITNVRYAEGGKEKLDLLATPFVTNGIVFDSGSDRLKPESASILRQVSTYLKENPEVRIQITGHTDDVGETSANQALSEKRAAAVATSLNADFGIDSSRLTTGGKGESVPVSANDSPEGRAMNRRVEFSKT